MPSIDISAVIALAALLQSPAAAEAVRQPKGKWIVDYADSMCVLQRDYGTAKSTLSLGIRRALMGDHDQLIVLTSARSGNNRMGVPATLSAEAGVVAVPTEAQSFFNRQQSLRLNQMEIPQALLSRSSGTQVLEVRVPGLVNERFAVPGLSDALAVLDECVVDLLEGWGVPRSEQRNLSSFAKPLGGRVQISPHDYPAPALRKLHSGSTVSAVAVSADGKPSNCRIMKSSKSSHLDQATCKALMRTTFEPARDLEGKATPSHFFQTVHWRIG